MEILVRDHLGDARLGCALFEAGLLPFPRRDEFLRTVAERSPDRVVRGRATLALAQYLKMKGEFVESLKKPASEKEEKTLLGLYGPEYLGQLRAADSGVRCSARPTSSSPECSTNMAISRTRSRTVRPSRETLADVVHRERRPGPVANPDEQFRTMDEAFRAAVKAADRAAEEAQKKAGKAEPGEASVRAYIAAYPKWP